MSSLLVLPAMGKNTTDGMPLRKIVVRLSIDLPPAAASDILGGIRQQLDEKLLRYSHEYRGVVISYEKEAVLSKKAMVHPYFPYFRVPVRAVLSVFQPSAGDIITGTVNQVGDDYVGLLVLGSLNAVIRSDNMGGLFSFKDGTWHRRGGHEQAITVGTVIRFAVEEIHEHGAFFSMSGSVGAKGTGPVSDEGSNRAMEEVGEPRKPAKKKEGKGDAEEATQAKQDKKKKKKKENAGGKEHHEPPNGEGRSAVEEASMKKGNKRKHEKEAKKLEKKKKTSAEGERVNSTPNTDKEREKKHGGRDSCEGPSTSGPSASEGGKDKPKKEKKRHKEAPNSAGPSTSIGTDDEATEDPGKKRKDKKKKSKRSAAEGQSVPDGLTEGDRETKEERRKKKKKKRRREEGEIAKEGGRTT